MSYPLIDRTGHVYGRLTITGRGVAPEHITSYQRIKSTWWKWQCICGNEGVSVASDLQCKHVQSCGCLNKDLKSARSHNAHLRYLEVVARKRRQKIALAELEALTAEAALILAQGN